MNTISNPEGYGTGIVETASIKLLKIGDDVVKQAEEIQKMVWSKLSAISRPAEPLKDKPENVFLEFPPLFTEIRGDFLAIEECLNSIRDALSLVEL